MADGYGFGAEGDWKSAVLVRLFKVMAAGLPGGTSFMEDYTYDLDPAGPSVLGAHMLEVCPSIAAGTAALRDPSAVDRRAVGSGPARVRRGPGPAIVAGLTDLGDRFRIVANVVDVVAPPHELPKLPVARAVWRPRPDLRTRAEAWLIAGGAHHTALSRALGPEPIADLAEMAGHRAAPHRRGDERRRFAKEVRWNQAYHRLARGL